MSIWYFCRHAPCKQHSAGIAGSSILGLSYNSVPSGCQRILALRCDGALTVGPPLPAYQVHIAPWGVYAPAVITGKLQAGQATADAEAGDKPPPASECLHD